MDEQIAFAGLVAGKGTTREERPQVKHTNMTASRRAISNPCLGGSGNWWDAFRCKKLQDLKFCRDDKEPKCGWDHGKCRPKGLNGNTAASGPQG